MSILQRVKLHREEPDVGECASCGLLQTLLLHTSGRILSVAGKDGCSSAHPFWWSVLCTAFLAEREYSTMGWLGVAELP